MEKLMFASLVGLVIRGAKEVLYKLLKRFELTVDSPMFGGVYDFGKGSFAIKLFTTEDLQHYKWLSIPETMKANGVFIVELLEATRDTNGVYEGKEWSITKGDKQLKVVG